MIQNFAKLLEHQLMQDWETQDWSLWEWKSTCIISLFSWLFSPILNSQFPAHRLTANSTVALGTLQRAMCYLCDSLPLLFTCQRQALLEGTVGSEVHASILGFCPCWHLVQPVKLIIGRWKEAAGAVQKGHSLQMCTLKTHKQVWSTAARTEQASLLPMCLHITLFWRTCLILKELHLFAVLLVRSENRNNFICKIIFWYYMKLIKNLTESKVGLILS